MASFLQVYNQKAQALADVQTGMNEIKQNISASGEWPDNAYFSKLTDKLNQFKWKICVKVVCIRKTIQINNLLIATCMLKFVSYSKVYLRKCYLILVQKSKKI